MRYARSGPAAKRACRAKPASPLPLRPRTFVIEPPLPSRRYRAATARERTAPRLRALPRCHAAPSAFDRLRRRHDSLGSSLGFHYLKHRSLAVAARPGVPLRSDSLDLTALQPPDRPDTLSRLRGCGIHIGLRGDRPSASRVLPPTWPSCQAPRFGDLQNVRTEFLVSWLH
jgi:hypothetical protein